MAAAQVLGPGGSEGGGTNSWEEALQVAQLGEDRHRGESGGPTCETKVCGVIGHLHSQGNQATPMAPGSSLLLQTGIGATHPPL